MKTKLKYILIIAVILFISVALNKCQAQGKHTSIMLGYKSIELGASYTLENELVIGLSAQATESGLVEERANRNDMFLNKHDITISTVPALYFTIGGQFDNFTMTGKLGGAYLTQTINSKPDSQKYYPAVGIIFDYQFSNGYSIRASYDNVSSGMVGIGFNF